MKAKSTFLIALMLAGVATIFTGKAIVGFYKSTGAVMLTGDYTRPYIFSAIIFIILSIYLAAYICYKCNWS